MGNVFIWCFYQWVDEEAEREDSGSGDYDYDCDCVVEWWAGGSLEWICGAGGRGGDKNILEWISCSFLLMVIFTLCIHEYNVIDGIVQIKFKKRFQFQFYKKHYKVYYWVVIQGKWEGGSQGDEAYGCPVGWWYLSYACFALDTNI